MKKNLFSTGRGMKKDDGVVLNYPTGRKIKDRSLKIGAGAYVRSGTVIYEGSCIGSYLETGHNVVIREENRIGGEFSIWNNSVVDYGCRIGKRVKIHSNCYIAQFSKIADDVFIAPGVTFANDFHPGCRHFRDCMKGPSIGRGAVIGVNVTVLPYVKIGRGALIGAGSVVTKDIPAYSVAVGNPAAVVKKIFDLKCKTGITDKPYHRRDK